MAIPARIPAEHQQEIRRMAALAFEAVSGEGLARVDFFYTRDGQILINEINTIPGLSPTSYFQKMWEASGLPLTPDHRPGAADRAEQAPRPAVSVTPTWSSVTPRPASSGS